jgi:hypothetical protein
VRDSVDVKLYEHEGELYVLAKSGGRQAKENAMRRKRWPACYQAARDKKFANATNCCCASAPPGKKPAGLSGS